jgi:phage repressor protein C with HTH and peptisase S24 domain
MLDYDFIRNSLLERMANERGFSSKVAMELGLPPIRLTEIKKGIRQIKHKELVIIAEILGLEKESAQVQVVGYVGAGGEAVFEDAYPQGGGAYTVESFPGLANVIGLEVRGDSMWPVFRDGHVIFIRRDTWDTVDEKALHDWAVCRLADGRTMLKEIRRSHEQGKYDLISLNAKPIEAVELLWATPVQGHRRVK